MNLRIQGSKLHEIFLIRYLWSVVFIIPSKFSRIPEERRTKSLRKTETGQGPLNIKKELFSKFSLKQKFPRDTLQIPDKSREPFSTVSPENLSHLNKEVRNLQPARTAATTTQKQSLKEREKDRWKANKVARNPIKKFLSPYKYKTFRAHKA